MSAKAGKEDDSVDVENDTVHASGQEWCQARPKPAGEEVKIVALCWEAIPHPLPTQIFTQQHSHCPWGSDDQFTVRLSATLDVL